MEIRECWVDRTRECRGEWSPWYEPFTNNRKRLFRSLVAEYGRCTGRMYRDHRTPAPDDGTTGAYREEAVPVGWVFEKRRRYEDVRGPGAEFLCETWVEVKP